MTEPEEQSPRHVADPSHRQWRVLRPNPRRMMLGLGAALPIAALAATLVQPPSPLLVWNASASSPIGLYRVGSARDIEPGDMILAWPPDEARVLGAERHYLPSNVPLVKRVSAAAGDTICASGEAIFVNGRRTAVRRRSDPEGRAMPWWSGCERLRAGDLLLLSPGVPLAFDGRYFGVSRSEQIVGSARLLWSR